MTLSIRPLTWSDALFAPFLAEAAQEGGSFLFRLRDEWSNGACRFDRPGEFLLGVFVDANMVAVGGVSLDPYAPAEGLGRVRHVYVLRDHRRRGYGRALIEVLLDGAKAYFTVLRLRTRSPEAARLYESFGFVRTSIEGETHRLALLQPQLLEGRG